jgi:hypothetical protein
MTAIDAAFDAFTRRFNDIAGGREFETLVSGVIHDGLRHDVLGSLIEGGRESQKLVGGPVRNGIDGDDARSAVRQSPGLVDDERVVGIGRVMGRTQLPLDIVCGET